MSCYEFAPFTNLLSIFADDDVVDDLNESESVEVNAKEEEEVLEPKPEETKPAKKIVLNRQIHIEIEPPKDDPATDATTAGADDKKADGAPVVSSAEVNYYSDLIYITYYLYRLISAFSIESEAIWLCGARTGGTSSNSCQDHNHNPNNC